MTIKQATPESIAQAAEILKKGDCVVIPTETVYGLAADATNGKAVAKIFDIKGRPTFNPLICHFRNLKQIIEYIELNEESKKMAAAFWPGPMTLIVNRKHDCSISDVATAGLPTVAIRIPAHPTAQKIIAAAGFPLAAPSANTSGEISPTNALHVVESLGDKCPLVIADGQSKIGLESTVIDMTGERAVILRPGAITVDDCAEVLGYDVEIDVANHDAPKSPGQLLKHYAPKTPVRLKAYDIHAGEALLAFGSTKFMAISKIPDTHILNLSADGDLFEAASNLFSYMRRLDALNANNIAVMDIPNIGIGLAINDRLKRAAEG